MATRIAAILSLCAFALTLLLGLEAQNSFVTTVWRATLAMLGTLFIGLLLGLVLQKMLEENLESLEKKLKTSITPTKDGRQSSGSAAQASNPPRV